MKRRTRKRPAELPGMGDLISLTVELENGKRVVWRFRERPILSFDYVSRDASGKGRQARLFVHCGRYRITDAGKCVALPTPKRRTVPVGSVSKRTRAQFEVTHGGLAAKHAVRCSVPVAGRKRFVGWCEQLDYRADKKKHGRVQYYHPVSRSCQQEIWVNQAGTQIYFRGGRLTVTPHGIEDLDD